MSARPQPGPLLAPRLAPRRRVTLASGLRVVLVELGAVPLCTARLVIGAGSAHLADGEVWLDRLAQDFLREGTATLDRSAIAGRFASMGGQLQVDGDELTTGLEVDVLAEYAAAAAALLIDTARTPRFPASETGRLVADQLRWAEIALQQPQWLAHGIFRASLYGGHPYARVRPDRDAVAAFTAQRARAFWMAASGVNQATLYVLGRFDADAVLAEAERAAAGWNSVSLPDVPSPLASTTPVIHFLARPNAEQSTLRVGVPVPPPGHGDAIGLEVMNALLGGSFGSRITTNIREDKGYTYSPSSSISTRPGDAYWVEAADITTEFTAPALHEILGEIERLREETPPASEVAGIQQYVVGTYAIRQATTGGVLDHLEYLAMHGLDDAYSTAYPERVQALTPVEVQRIARDYLRRERMTIVVVGDPGIRASLAEFGRVEDWSGR